ncbi:hypothetical protein PENTCL1PPCAC_12667 [Pristionchus entomophagus]|uniref:G protein-coupled receptor n=1 Tax=Pristionchus entomophagus TaxID=358040 RepID=A0AAV5T4I8_9BILA|nr:hypothetical protein PENTCL1PPCAC_12667 [Pristionchus entomophagus]
MVIIIWRRRRTVFAALCSHLLRVMLLIPFGVLLIEMASQTNPLYPTSTLQLFDAMPVVFPTNVYTSSAHSCRSGSKFPSQSAISIVSSKLSSKMCSQRFVIFGMMRMTMHSIKMHKLV